MKTYMAKTDAVSAKWYVVDATDMVLGRLASQVAAILKGKHKAEYTPHVDTGDYVIVVNCEKIKLTGDKLEKKEYKYYTGYMGGLRLIKYGKMLDEKPEFVIEKAIKGMLPKNSLGRDMIKKLRVYKGGEHGHTAQKPETLVLEG